jgi:hypothetical protein
MTKQTFGKHARRAAVVLAYSGLTQGLACGQGHVHAPGTSLLDDTTAGRDRCVLSKSHERPFVIEWDATDLAAFEAKASRDVVFVHYEGCVLTVLDGCRDEAIAGRFGVYAPPTFHEWKRGGHRHPQSNAALRRAAPRCAQVGSQHRAR